MVTRIRTLPVFPGQAERRMNVMLEVLRHEPAMALLELMNEGRQTANLLTTRLKRATGNLVLTMRYLERVLVPSSLADKIDLGLGERTTYSLKESAKKYGIPATDFTINYGYSNDFWLGDILGRGLGEIGIKACGRRYVILKALYGAQKPLSKLTLSLSSHSHVATVSKDIANLISFGLVNSESVDIDSFGFRAIEWKGGNPNLPGSENRDGRFVANFLSKVKRASLAEIVSGTNLSASQIISGIHTLIENRLVRGIDKFPITKKYEITMTDAGKRHWNGYFVPLYEFLSDRKPLPIPEQQWTTESYIRMAMNIFKERTED